MPNLNSICVTSYNSTGFNASAQNHIQTLLLFSDICCLQEHFLLDCKDKGHSNTDKLRSAFGSLCDMHIVPAVKSNTSVSRGRGSGGLTTMWRKTLTKYAARVACDNPRVLGTKFTLPDCSLLLINAYFPCDPRVEDFDDSEVIRLLVDIRTLIENSDCNNILLAGDLNCHFERYSHFTNMVRESLDDLSLNLLWQQPGINVDFTYCCTQNENTYFSTIDHFAVSTGLLGAVNDAGVVHTGENLSNHSAIYVKIDVGRLDIRLEKSAAEKRSSWVKASYDAKELYKIKLAEKLNHIPVYECISCKNVHCVKKIHHNGIEDYTLDVLEAMESTGKECLPIVGSCSSFKNKKVSGWNEFVKPYADESNFWYQLWLSAGKPSTGDLFINMKLSKRQYKFAVRRLKRCQDKINNEKLANALLNNNEDIFKEIKRIRGKTNSYSTKIDDREGPCNIANHFATIYEDLYNNVALDDKFQKVHDSVIDSVDDSSHFQLQRINQNVIKDVIKKLKPNKKDAIFDMSSDFFLNAPNELIAHLTNIIKLYFCHGYIPQVVLMCTLAPLIKDSLGDHSSSRNYRAIAGGCLLLKIIDLVVLFLEGDKLNLDCMQFAYQEKSSTTMCTWTAKSVIEYFNRKGAPVYSAAMDMTKAFDLVSWKNLFGTLLQRKIDGLFLRLILFIYMNQECNVKWCGKNSYCFSVKNGVRQGAVSSGILFAIYIDDILGMLRRSGLGCHIHGIFFGALFYADDILLLSASRTGLQQMVNICHDAVQQRNLSFGTNADPTKSKTKCIVFAKKNNLSAHLKLIQLGNHELPWVQSVKHLGHILQTDNSMKMDIACKRGSFIGKTNSLLQEFGNVQKEVFLKLMHTSAMTLYGSNLWNLFSKDCERLYTSYNVAIRNILNLDRCSHRFLLEPLSNALHLKTVLLSKFVGFHKALITSKKFPVCFLARLLENDLRSVHGKNLSEIARMCHMGHSPDIEKLKPAMVKDKVRYRVIPDDETWRIDMCKELMNLRRNDDIQVVGFTTDELEELLTFLCVF